MAADQSGRLAFTNSTVPPVIRHDHGFLDDGNGAIDASRYRDPTASDHVALAYWITKLRGAQVLRPDLKDGTDTYAHYLFGGGATFPYSYERFIAGDSSGKTILDSAVIDTVGAAIQWHDVLYQHLPPQSRVDKFQLTSDGLGAGAPGSARYPYPATENWQKAIGAHSVWVEAEITVVVGSNRQFEIFMRLFAEDMYNFNPGAADIATGIPDDANGRFQVARLAYEFLTKADISRRVFFSAGLTGTVADPFKRPADLRVSGAPIVAPPAPGHAKPTPPPPPPPLP